MGFSLPPDTRLWRCPERQIGTRLPIPLSARLDVLAEIGKDAWAPISRKEVLCAVILDLPPTSRALGRAVMGYRSATVSDACVPGWPLERFLRQPNSPGRRAEPRLFREIAVATPHGREFRDVPDASDPGSLPCHPDERLYSAAAYRIGMIIPSPLADRADLLVVHANAAGLMTTRQELVAAVILAAPSDPKWLARHLRQYWHATVADAAIPSPMPPEPIRTQQPRRPPRKQVVSPPRSEPRARTRRSGQT